MSGIGRSNEAPHVVLIGGRLYGSGDTRQLAIADFRAQITGALPAMRASLTRRAEISPVSAGHASEVAEMRAADAISWSDTEPGQTNDHAPRTVRPVESFRTEAYQAGWRAFESGARRDDTPCSYLKPFSAWYDWRAGFDDRSHLEAVS